MNLKTLRFETERAYIEAWEHFARMGCNFTYARGQRLIIVDTDQPDFDDWSLFRMKQIQRDYA
jgi:hypothetical protein